MSSNVRSQQGGNIPVTKLKGQLQQKSSQQGLQQQQQAPSHDWDMGFSSFQNDPMFRQFDNLTRDLMVRWAT